MKKLRKQEGYNLIELVLVMAVLSVIFVYSLGFFREGSIAARGYEFGTQITDLKSRIARYYTYRASYAAPPLNNALVIAQRLHPPQMLRGAVLGSVITTNFVVDQINAGTQMRIQFTVLRDYCTEIFSYIESQFEAITVTSSAGGARAIKTAAAPAPDLLALAAECAEAGSANYLLLSR